MRIDSKDLKDLLEKLKSPELEACIKAALEAGNAIVDMEASAKEKADEFMVHHSIVTETDLLSQEITLKILLHAFPDSYAVGEEEDAERFAVFSGRLLTGKNYLDKIKGHVFIIDSLDGTSNYDRARKLGQWGISISSMKKLVQQAGVLYFPIRNLLVFAAKDRGTYKIENGKAEKIEIGKEEPDIKNQFVYFGVDTPFSGLSKFLEIYSGNTRTANTNGSCALGMALVAIDEADAFVQPLQRVWDPPAGYLVIREAGGEVIWYTISGLEKDKNGKVTDWGKIERVDEPEEKHFNPATKELGFVAARSKRIAEHWFKILEVNYGK